MDVHDALTILDLPRSEGYYDHPIPSAEDSRIGRAVKAFTTAAAGQSQSPSQSHAAQGEITSEQEQGATRGAFAERAPQTPPALIPPPVGIPIAIALALVALATIAGFYTPALRTRLRRR